MGRITFQKRQKEMKRQEKQKAKAERREQRKLEKPADPADLDASIDTSSEARTGGFDFSADPKPQTPQQ